ncbi:AbrB/MazE/SpoVT family DNA-binding domain-containing protein [Halopenitus persicus]|uniref:Antidote-toxin recognition MazE, antitoxin n=1 Tax=Halopenitus persicus TaxID=1048396 RepID=A0A1H3FGR6_9EURY|nr:AbrB/MazE/SpoVT family DNA-binding domain-containing protein [Halopenitus persicus]SDX90191.1 Antidote-toxin recognition MazE, antitoxin [Halopenitus persicus]
METRKVQTVGNGTYTVSLPKEWAEAEGVAAGDTVTLHRHTDGILAIQARNASENDGRDETVDRDADGDGSGTTDRSGPAVRTAALDPRSLAGTLRAAYAAGVRTVELDHEEPLDVECRRAIESVLRRRIGTSTTETAMTETATTETATTETSTTETSTTETSTTETPVTETSTTETSTTETSTTETDGSGTAVRMLLDPGEVSVSQSVRQLAFVVDATQRAAIEALATAGDRSTVAERSDHAARLSAMIDRTVTLGLADLEAADAIGASRPALFESWTAMRELERVREAAADVAAAADRMDEPPTESRVAETRELAADVRSIVADGVGVVVGDDDAEAARQALAAEARTREAIDAFDRRLATAEGSTPELRAVLSRLRRTAERGGAIAELGLRRTMRRENVAADRPVRTAESASR